MNIFYVYAHYTVDTNKLFYIGKGKNKRYLDKSQRNKYWKNVVDKHGFRAEILVKNLEEPDAFIQEILAIKQFKPKCNIRKGGIGGFTKINSGNFKKGNKPWNTGIKRPDMSKNQMGEKNHMYGKPSATRKRVVCHNDGNIFESLEQCYTYYKISKSGFFKSLKENKPIKKLRFSYV